MSDYKRLTNTTDELMNPVGILIKCRDRLAELEDKIENGTLIDIETVAKLMVEMFDDCPCNYNDIDEYMYEHCGDWCDKSCDSVYATGDYTPCWVKYLTAKLNELKREQQ